MATDTVRVRTRTQRNLRLADSDLACDEGRGLFRTMASMVNVDGYACIHSMISPSHGFTFLTVLVALTLILVCMIMVALNGRANVTVPTNAQSSISDSGRKYLDHDGLSQRANEIEP